MLLNKKTPVLLYDRRFSMKRNVNLIYFNPIPFLAA